MIYMQARYYFTEGMRFTSADPVQFSVDNPQMFNRYSYVANDPINNIDPDGRCSEALSGSATLCGAADAIANAIEPVIESAMRAAGVDVVPEGQRDPEGIYSHTASPESAAAEGAAVAGAVFGAAADRVNPARKINKQKQAGHVPGTPQNRERQKQGKPTSTFFGAKSGDKLTQDTARNGTVIRTDPNGGETRRKNFGVTTGVDANGKFVTGVETRSDARGVVHGFPCSGDSCPNYARRDASGCRIQVWKLRKTGLPKGIPNGSKGH